MNDMSSVIVAKSDQLNADDLISGPRIITITDVKIAAGTEQPVSIFFHGDDGKPWRPCKTMSRVLVGAWGPDAKAYVGRSLRLYRDPNVTWGGMKVGGIRVSHMSDIQGDLVMALMASNKKKAVATIKPLAQQTQPPQPSDDATLALIATLQNLARGGMAALEAGWKEIGADARKALKAELPALKKIAEEADADDFNSPPAPQPGTPTAEAGPSIGTEEVAAFVPEGPDDSQRGDGDSDAMVNEASAWIDRYEAACRAEPDGKKLPAIHRTADATAARIKADFPDLYADRLDAIRPADAPEKAGGLPL
jgi:hypothetical protein